MLEAELIAAHLRLSDEEFTEQAATLTAYGRAAWRLVENTIGRRVYDVGPLSPEQTAEELAALLPAGAPEGSLPLDDDLRLAMLLLVAHWDKNREAVSENGTQAQQALPLAFEALTNPYRWFNL